MQKYGNKLKNMYALSPQEVLRLVKNIAFCKSNLVTISNSLLRQTNTLRPCFGVHLVAKFALFVQRENR